MKEDRVVLKLAIEGDGQDRMVLAVSASLIERLDGEVGVLLLPICRPISLVREIVTVAAEGK